MTCFLSLCFSSLSSEPAMTWGTLTVKDVAELAILAGTVLWHFASINARLTVLEELVKMLVLRSGMTDSKVGD